MKRVLIAAAVVGAVGLAGGAALAQAQPIEQTTATTTSSQTRESSSSRSSTRDASVGVDGGALIEALVGALTGQSAGRDDGGIPRGEPLRPEDVAGTWSVRDQQGRAGGACAFDMGERSVMGGRPIRTRDCHGLEAHYYRLAGDEVVVYRNSGEEVDRLRPRDGHLFGRRLLLSRPGRREPAWSRDWAGQGAGGWDRPGGRGGWSRRLATADVAGEWRTIEERSGFRRECRVTFSDAARFNGLHVSSSGCFGDLMSVSYWRLEDGRLAIYRPGGRLLVMLDGDARRLRGDGPGGEIVLYR